MRCCLGLWVALLGSVLTTSAPAANLNWLGGGADNNWSTAGNWSGGDTNPTDDSLFYDVTDLATLGTVNGRVDGNYTVASMKFDHPSAASDQGHTIEIPSGTTLTVSGTMSVGRYGPWPTSENNKYVTALFTGGGQMVVNGGLTVRNAGADSPKLAARLDVSGLSRFTVDTTANIHLGGTNNGRGELVLAPDSLLRAANLYIPGEQSWATGGLVSSLLLGQQATLNADKIAVGGYGLDGTMLFQTGLGNPLVTIRNQVGTGRANLFIGDMADNDRNVVGTVDLTGGAVDAELDQLQVGVANIRDAVRHYLVGATGTLRMAAGTIDANAVVLGRTVDGDVNASRPWTNGTLDLRGGQFTAGTITLGQDEANNDRARGTIIFSGGTLAAGTIGKGVGGGEAFFNWTGGTLSVDHFGLDLVQDNTDRQSILAPGRSIGTTTIDGDYLMNGGILQIEIDPATSTSDLVTVAGQATLGGQLQVVLLDPDVTLGATFDVLTAEAGILDNLTLISGGWLKEVLGPTGGLQTLRLTAVPEPSAFVLAFLGLLGLGLAGRRRRTRECRGGSNCSAG